tara:strand:- start:40 stop:333 length:294 start_codon:yes stop_codon:yes gene_type:complete
MRRISGIGSAMRSASLLSYRGLARFDVYSKQNSYHHAAYYQTVTTIAHQRQCQPLGRQYAEIDAKVDACLNTEYQRYAKRQVRVKVQPLALRQLTNG